MHQTPPKTPENTTNPAEYRKKQTKQETDAPRNHIAINKNACLFVVADGMGGHNAGEVASRLSIEKAKEWFNNTELKEITPKLLDDLIVFVNSEVWDYSTKHPETKGMGTTFSAILFKADKAFIAHIGDSRIYRLRDNSLEQLTTDHSLVGEQVKTGKLTPEQARVHPARHILSRVLGARQFVKPEILEVDIKQDDIFVLITDGIYSMMEDSIQEKIIKETQIKHLSDRLVSRANKNGGKDNSTVVALKLSEFPIKFPAKFSIFRLFKILSSLWSSKIE